MVVNRDSCTPPYRQVADVLRMRIESGDLGPRRRLPSIAELVEEHGVARVTAARAQQALVDEGLAEVVPGWGTYVLERRLPDPVDNEMASAGNPGVGCRNVLDRA